MPTSLINASRKKPPEERPGERLFRRWESASSVRSYFELGRYQDSEKLMIEMLRLCPRGNTSQRTWLGSMLIRNGRYNVLSFVQNWFAHETPPRRGYMFPKLNVEARSCNGPEDAHDYLCDIATRNAKKRIDGRINRCKEYQKDRAHPQLLHPGNNFMGKNTMSTMLVKPAALSRR
ncbi:hypothetical protein H0H87_008885 [Tephrocybe sp. NHM501043]|nr:hypothetical protein H0H87_008885 [Tephrocybe sp. NHM501043]